MKLKKLNKKNIDVTDFVDTSLINIDDEDETEHSIDDDKIYEDNENIDNNEKYYNSRRWNYCRKSLWFHL